MSTTEAAGENAQVIKITTSDSVTMDVQRQVAERSILIKNLLEDLGGDMDEPIPIPNVCLLTPLTLNEHALIYCRSTRPL
jgi:S-phase kinase-associated protein 1